MSGDFDYTVKNALLWGNCAHNFEKAKKASEAKNHGKAFGYGMLGVVQAIPVIGQAVSLIEMGVKNSLKGRAKPIHPETGEYIYEAAEKTKAQLTSINPPQVSTSEPMKNAPTSFNITEALKPPPKPAKTYTSEATTVAKPPAFDQGRVTQNVVNNFLNITPRFKLEKNEKNQNYQVKLLFKNTEERDAAIAALKTIGIPLITRTKTGS